MISPLYGQLSPLRVPTLTLEAPKTVAGLQLWLDATTGLYDATSGGSVVTTDSTAVARWEDRSDNAWHFTQATENNRPFLKTSQLNGKNVVRFDGMNDSLLLGATTLLRNVSGYTFFAVRKNRSSVSALKILFVNASTRFEFNTQSTNNVTLRVRRLATDTLTTLAGGNSSTTANTFQLFCGKVDHANTTATLYRNGTQLATNTAFLTSGNTNDVSNGSGLGANAAGANQWSDADIAEVLIYHEALSDTDRGKIESYLTTKWGL
jgi:hypothetical protein